MTDVDVELSKIKNAKETQKEQQLTQIIKNASEKDVKQLNNDIEQNVNIPRAKEQKEVNKTTKKQLAKLKKEVEKTALNNNLLKEYFITNEK